MSNDILVSCPKCREWANVGKVGKIWDPYGIEISNFIGRHQACGAVQLSDSNTYPDPLDGLVDDWKSWKNVENEIACPHNLFIDAWCAVRYQWFRTIQSVRKLRRDWRAR